MKTFLQLHLLSLLLYISLQSAGQDSLTYKMAENNFGSGRFFYEKGQYGKAVNFFLESNKAIPAAVTWYFLGLAYNNLDKYQQGFNSMNTALAFNPRLAEKFRPDAMMIKSHCEQWMNAAKTGFKVSGQALTMLPKVPSKDENPYIITTMKVPPTPRYRIIKDRLFFPGGGVRNENTAIGDFCCTGETGVVRRNDNSPLGYVYYYDWTPATENTAMQFRVLLSGAPSIEDISSDRIKDQISFDATSELYANAVKKKKVGAITYKITILSVTRLTARSFNEVRIQVDVQ